MELWSSPASSCALGEDPPPGRLVDELPVLDGEDRDDGAGGLPHDAVTDWLRDEATNQTRFRAINESIEHMTDALDVHEPRDVYVCECSDGDCREPIG